MKFLFSSAILAAAALASTPCTNGIDGSITGQYLGWTCQSLDHLLLGPDAGYCTIEDLAVACCACGGGGTVPSNPTPNPTSAPQPTPTPTAPAVPTADPTAPAVPTAEPTNPSGNCQPLWGQCGGAEWSGATCCQEGVCTAQSIHYSQCSPNPNPTTPTPNPTSPVTPSPTQPVVTPNPTNPTVPTPNPTNPTVPTPQPTNPTSQPTDPTPVTPEPSNAPATPTPQPTQGDHSSSASDSWNVCYFTNWARYRNGLINEGKDVFEMGFDADMCTHFMYGFMKVSQDYDIISSDPNADHPSGHMGQNELCNEACNDPNFKTDWSDPDGERCDWPCNPTRTMRGYEAMNVGMKAKNPNLKTLISVGGWNFNDCAASPADTVGQGSASCEIFSTIAKDENKIRLFAANIINFARRWGFNGFDLDWEYPVVAGHNSNHKVDGNYVDEIVDYTNYITMLRVLKEEFAKEQLAPGHETLLLTAAVGVGKGTVETAYNIPEMSKYLDQINLMTYDMHGGWESRTGCNAPLYATDEDVAYGGAVGAGVETEGYPLSVSWAVDYWLSHGAKPEQLTMGVGTYGRGWKLDDTNNNGYNAPASSKSAPGSATGEAGYLAYYEIMDLLANNQATRHYDSERECPYIITNSGEWIGYDDKESMKKKMDFLKSRNIRGAMVWALDLDDFNGSYHNGEKYPIINFIRDELRDYDPSVTHHSRRLQG